MPTASCAGCAAPAPAPAPPLLHRHLLLHLSTPPLLTTACRRSLLSLEHALAVAGFMVCHRTLPPKHLPPNLVLTLQPQVLMCTCAYIISKRI
jgi:hypothetical protein